MSKHLTHCDLMVDLVGKTLVTLIFLLIEVRTVFWIEVCNSLSLPIDQSAKFGHVPTIS